MSKFSDRLNDARGEESIRAASARAAKDGTVGESTLYPYFRAEHPRPTMPVVVALAAALSIPIQELRELADIPAEGETWTPPAESRLMNDRQRRAVTELIRSFVQTQGAENATPVDPSTQSDAQAEGDKDKEAGDADDEGVVRPIRPAVDDDDDDFPDWDEPGLAARTEPDEPK